MADKQLKVVLLRDCIAGLARNEADQYIATHSYVGKTGIVIEINDDAYNTDRPTGYEPCNYLVDFGDEKLWIPSSLYMGFNYETNRDIWVKLLKFVD